MIKNITLFSFILLFVVCFFTSILNAQQNDENGVVYRLEDLLELSIEELAELPVVTYPKSYKNLSIQPSNSNSIEVKNADLGLESTFVKDILSFDSSFQLYDNGYFVGGGQRGLVGNFSETLLMVNGREMNSLFSNQAFLSHQLSVFNLKKIDINHGPGLFKESGYAYAGVINMLTNDLSKGLNSQINTHITFGSFGQRSLGVAFGKKSLGGFKVNGDVHYYKDNSFDYTSFIKNNDDYSPTTPLLANGLATDTTQAKFNDEREGINLNLDLSYKGFYGGANIYSLSTTQQGQQFVSFDYNNANPENRNLSLFYGGYKYSENRTQLTIEYQFTLEKIWGAYRNYDFRKLAFDNLLSSGRTTPLSQEEIHKDFTLFYSQKNSNGSQRHRTSLSISNEIPIETKSDFLRGNAFFDVSYVFDLRNVVGLALSPYNTHPSFDEMEDGVLNNSSFNSTIHEVSLMFRKSIINENLLLVLGGKYNLNENYGNGRWLTRSGIIYDFNNYKSLIKLFFSEAIKYPSVNELLSLLPSDSLVVNTSLQPSLLQNWDMSYNTEIKKNVRLSVGLFRINVSDRLEAINHTEWINNNDLITNQGIYANFDAQLNKLITKLSYTYTQSNSATNIYEHSGVLNIGVKLKKLATFSTTARYYSDIQINETTTLPQSLIFDAVLQSKEIKMKDSSIKISVGVQNMGDTNQFFPNTTATSPQQFVRMGRRFYTQLKLNI